MAGSSIFSICNFYFNIKDIVLYCIHSSCFETLRISSRWETQISLVHCFARGKNIQNVGYWFKASWLLSKLLKSLPKLRLGALANWSFIKKNCALSLKVLYLWIISKFSICLWVLKKKTRKCSTTMSIGLWNNWPAWGLTY